MRVLSILFALALACGLNAQRYYFENISVAQGLPATKVYCALQDSTGLVWLGTESGLASFDGTNVVTFGLNEGMAQGGVRSLFLDKDKRLWCGHLGGGLSISHGRRFRALTLGDQPVTADVTAISQSPDGAMWIGTFGMGVLRVKELPEEGPVTAERFMDGKGPGERITSIVRLRSGDMVFLDPGAGLRQWTSAKGAFEPFAVQALADQQRVTSFFEDRSGGLWVGTQDHGAVRWSGGKLTSYDQPTGMPGSFVYAFGEDNEDHVWISTWDHGLVRVDKDGLHLFGKGNGSHSQNIRSIARDREGNLLLATNDEGLEIYKGDRFLSFTADDGLVERHVRAVAETRDGRLWFGTLGGISVLDPSASGPLSVRSLTVQQGVGLTNNSISSILADDQGHIYVGTDDGGLLEALGSGPTFVEIPISAELGNNRVTALAKASGEGFYVGTLGGLVHFVPGGFTSKLGKGEGLAGSDVTALFTDPEGRTWVGSASSGVSVIDAKSATHATPVELGSVVTPTCFTQDAAGRIWVGTQSQGIFVLDNRKVVVNYDLASGLLSNNIRSLVTDANGHIWIGTSKGLNERTKDGTTFLAYTERSGFTGIEASPGATLRTGSGDLWFGTSNGAVKVVVDHGSERAEPPLIAVRVLKVNLEERDAIDGVDLSHTERDVRIEFGCVSLIDQGAVRYQYMLEGLEKDWQPVTAETDAHYPGLSPGKYVFKVRARNRAGIMLEGRRTGNR